MPSYEPTVSGGESTGSKKGFGGVQKKAIGFIGRRLSIILPLLLVWEVSARFFVDSNLLPSFSAVVETFIDGIFSPPGVNPYGGSESIPVLLYQAIGSLTRVGSGFFIAVLIGVPLGFMMGYSRFARTNFDPIVSILRPIPPIAWIPLAILWFGLGIEATIFIIFVGTIFPIILNTQQGVSGTPRRLIEFAQVLGASRKQILIKVIAYEAFPSIITGMRLGFGIGWMSVVAAEMIAAKSGLGYLIMTARWTFATDMVFAGMLMIGVIGYLGDGLLRLMEQRFSRWRADLVHKAE